MLTASFVLTALAITVLLGAGITAYLWLVHRPKLVARTGITTLAAMRWREFSRFVADAMRRQGFEPLAEEPRTGKAEQAELLLTRDGQTWLLSCKQGANSVVTDAQVEEVAKSVRDAGAGGGILATLGTISPAARARSRGIELIDGLALWADIEPLLSQSLSEDLANRARASAIRNIQLGWLVALLLGFAVAMLLASRTPAAPDAPAVTPAAAPAVQAGQPTAPTANATSVTTAPAPIVDPTVAAPVPEGEQDRRNAAREAIASLPGFAAATWSSQSTLLVQLQDDEASKSDIAALCATLERYEELRASRVQLQPPAGSDRPVRFMQCHVY